MMPDASNNSFGVQSRKRTSIDVSNIILTRLQRGQIHASQSFEDFRNTFDAVSAKLDLLSCGDVECAVAQA